MYDLQKKLTSIKIQWTGSRNAQLTVYKLVKAMVGWFT